MVWSLPAQVAVRAAAAKILETIHEGRQRAAQRAAAAIAAPADDAPVAAAPAPKKSKAQLRLMKSLRGGMIAVQAKSEGKKFADKRFQAGLGVRTEAPTSDAPGLENGAAVLLWRNREWVPCRVREFRDDGPAARREVLVHELGKEDLADCWVAEDSPRLIKVDVDDAFGTANKRRGDFVKVGQRVESAWAPRDERVFWSTREGGALGPAGTVLKVAPRRDAAEVDLDGLCGAPAERKFCGTSRGDAAGCHMENFVDTSRGGAAGRDVDSSWRRVAAAPRGATWIVRVNGSRRHRGPRRENSVETGRRRGDDVDIPRRRVAAPPRLRARYAEDPRTRES